MHLYFDNNLRSTTNYWCLTITDKPLSKITECSTSLDAMIYLLPPSALPDTPLTADPISAALEAVVAPLNLKGNSIFRDDLVPTSAANLNSY